MRETLSAKPDEERLAHKVVADIELDDLGNRGDRDDIIIVEAVAGMHFEPGLCRRRARRRSGVELAVAGGTVASAAAVQ